MAIINIRYPNGYPENSRKPDIRILDGPNITANLYCICLSELETCAFAEYTNWISGSDVHSLLVIFWELV